MPTPTYLAKNRHGAFIFRIRVPECLWLLFSGKRAITKSLQTYHRPTALKLARRYASISEDLFDQLRMKDKYLIENLILKGRLSTNKGESSELIDKLSTEALKLLLSKNSGTSEELDAYLAKHTNLEHERSDLLKKLTVSEKMIATADKIEARLENQAIAQQVLNDYKLAGHIRHTAHEEPKTPKLSVLWEQFRKDKVRKNKWKESDASKMKEPDTQFRDFIEIIGGDIPASQFLRANADSFIDALKQFPLNRHKKWGSIKDLKSIPSDALKLSQSTVAQRIEQITGFFNYLETEEIITSNPFKGKSLERNSENYPTPTAQDIQDWFNLPDALIKNAWQFWIPRLALFTGARQNEIAQLTPNDILQCPDHKIWYLSINTIGGKRIKSAAANRKCPIHPSLIENGFLQYVEAVKRQGFDTLWPNLTAKGGDKGQTVSRYWTELRTKHKVLLNPKGDNGKYKVFHSLRRIIINKLTEAGIDLIIVQTIVGHEPSLGATAQYLDIAKPLNITAEAVNLLVIDGISWRHAKKFDLSPK